MSEPKYKKNLDLDEKYRVSAILSEQLKLKKIEKELQNLLTSVNQQINVLKVEELQLKAHQMSLRNSEQFSDNDKDEKNDYFDTPDVDIPEELNKQLLDLDTFVKKIEEEFESDSDS